jgi:hypothetical protein
MLLRRVPRVSAGLLVPQWIRQLLQTRLFVQKMPLHDFCGTQLSKGETQQLDTFEPHADAALSNVAATAKRWLR